MCTPGFKWEQLGVAAYKKITTGEGDTLRDWNRTRGSCDKCGTDMEASSLHHHTNVSQRIVMPQNWRLDFGGGGLETYAVSFPQMLKYVACPVDGFLVREHDPGRFIENFMYRHWKLKIEILQ